ncbi:MAG TPA: ATP-dependent helicase, partial [Jatrophihabitans sp.]|nr:ATP-dependent helicase [Jatrophihabitans sp.]
MSEQRSARFSPTDLAKLLGLPEPTAEQAEVIAAPLSPAVVIAGAGSGKTETMAARVVWLVANGLVPPERVLGLTFTRKAAGELQQRIRRRLRALHAALEPDALPAEATGEPTVLTYAAYAGRLVDEHGIVLGREPGDRLLTEAARWQLADLAVRNYTGTFQLPPGVIATVTERVLDLAGQLADHLIEPEQVRQLSERLLREINGLDRKPRSRTDFPGSLGKLVESLIKRLDLLPLVSAFADRKRADGLLDFADQMVLASQLAGRESVVAIERSRYDVVLLDEYQDTGYAQIQMLAGLFADGRAVTAVGDPLQSIYSWRGASAGNIGRFATLFRDAERRPASRYGLMTSWRNDEAILAAANAVAGPLRERGDRPLAERPGAGSGLVRLRYADTVRTEAAWLAEQLAEQWRERADWTDGRRTLAVLVRKRSAIGLIAQAIRAAGLPVEVVDIGGLLTLPEVADVRAMLSVLADHAAGGSLARLLTGARWRIGASDLVALHEHARRQARRMSMTVVAYARTAADKAAAGQSEGTRPAPAPTGPAPTDAQGTDEQEFDQDERIEPSLIEALDDLDGLTDDEREAFSAAGYWRMVECARMLRRLRRRLELPLPDLIAEIERELGLDAEVAARRGEGYSALAGRANLDRFSDEAARFVADRSGASVSAFLGYLKAAEQEEYGLKPATVEVAPDRVQVLTVHGAKGLEWDVVAVAGLVRNSFPDQAKGHDWTTMPSLLPSPLRGDADQLPRFEFGSCLHRGDAETCLDEHHSALGERHVQEERRLAYVAFTRARKVL